MYLILTSGAPIIGLLVSRRFFAPTVTNLLVQLLWLAASVHIPVSVLITGLMS